MKRFLLTVLVNLEKEEDCRNLALALTPIVDSAHLKFRFSKSVILFHFGTEVSKDEVFDFILGILYGITNSFILTEVNDKMTVHLQNEGMDNFMDLNTDEGNYDMKIDMEKVKTNFDFNEEVDEEDFVALLLGEKSILKRPTLDQILDKMNDKGYSSLTEYEKETLENYSK